MLRFSVLLLGLAAVSAAATTATTTATIVKGDEKKTADEAYLKEEKAILQLFYHIHQPLLNPKLVEIAQNFDKDWEKSLDTYKDKKVVIDFMKKHKAGMWLKKGEEFSALEKDHLHQAIALFDLFYFAKDWETFYKSAVWARHYVNEEMFVYSFTIALRHWPKTKPFVLPPIYEIMPHKFVRSETIEKIYKMKMMYGSYDMDYAIFPSNFTEWYNKKSTPDMKIAYFTEDIALNSWNWELHVDQPWWLTNKKYGLKFPHRGEKTYHKQHLILARYWMERLSNHLSIKDKFIWDEEITGFAPHMRYNSGKEMPMRPDHMKVHDLDDMEVQQVKELENKLYSFIKMGKMTKEDGTTIKFDKDNFELLGRLMDNSLDGVNPHQYGSLLRKMLSLIGHMSDPYHAHDLAPSALMHWETMLRDPMYYKVLYRAHEIFNKKKSMFMPYKHEDLRMEGIKIESLEVDKLMTFFEPYDVEMSNAVDVKSIEESKKAKFMARQMRINHKPFAIRMTVDSEKEMPATIRVFLGPKRDANGMELTWAERRHMMVELDRFQWKFQPGKNKIERHMKDATLLKDDKISFRMLYKKVDDALTGKVSFYIDDIAEKIGFPMRLALPKGKKNGMPYTLFVMVTPLANSMKYHQQHHHDDNDAEHNEMDTMRKMLEIDAYPMGFPFDQKIDNSEFYADNMIDTEVMIYHKKTDENFESF